jgi:hypothetical protein
MNEHGCRIRARHDNRVEHDAIPLDDDVKALGRRGGGARRHGEGGEADQGGEALGDGTKQVSVHTRRSLRQRGWPGNG